VEIKVKTKRGRENWHSDVREAQPNRGESAPLNERKFWVFVNLMDRSDTSRFWVVPDSWLRGDIHTAHEAYLAKRDGKRSENDDSTHHAIAESRLTMWEDKWDILNIFS
jgi:hypothetical protein